MENEGIEEKEQRIEDLKLSLGKKKFGETRLFVNSSQTRGIHFYLTTSDFLCHGFVNGVKRPFDVNPYRGFQRRFGVGFMGLLPVASQLQPACMTKKIKMGGIS